MHRFRLAITPKKIISSPILIILIILTGILLRLWALLGLEVLPISDFEFYYKRAIAFFQGTDFYTPFKPMGYPILLGALFKLVGSTEPIYAKYLNLVFGGLTLISSGVLAYQLRLSPSKRVLLVSIAAFFPMSVFYVTILGVETATVFLLFLMLNFLVWDHKWLSWIPIGIIAGLLSTLKSFFILIPFGILVVYWLVKKNRKEMWQGTAVVGAAFLLTVLPFTVKNYQSTEHFMLVPTNQNIVLFVNNNAENFHGGFIPFANVKPTEPLLNDLEAQGYSYPPTSGMLASNVDTYKYHAVLRFEAMRWIRYHFGSFVQLSFLRLGRVFYMDDSLYFPLFQYQDVENSHPLKVLRMTSDIAYYALSTLLLLYLAQHAKNLLRALFSTQQRMSVFSAIIFVFSVLSLAVYAVGEGQGRYFFSLFPFAALAALTIVLPNDSPAADEQQVIGSKQ